MNQDRIDWYTRRLKRASPYCIATTVKITEELLRELGKESGDKFRLDDFIRQLRYNS